MAAKTSFTVYDPKLHAFRVLDTADTVDLPFEQVLLLNILIELRTLTEYVSTAEQDPPVNDPDEVRQAMVEEVVN